MNRRNLNLWEFYEELLAGLVQVKNQRDVWPNVVLQDLIVDCTPMARGSGQQARVDQVWIDKDFPGDLVLRRCLFLNACDRIAIGNSTTRNAILLEDIEVEWRPDSKHRILDASYCRAGTWLRIDGVRGFDELNLRGARSNHQMELSRIRGQPALDLSEVHAPGSVHVTGGAMLSHIVAEGCEAAAFSVEPDVMLGNERVGVSLCNARIGQLDLHASSFASTTDIAVDLSNAEIGTLSFDTALALPKPVRFGNAMICQWTWRDDGGSDAEWINDVLSKDNAIPAGVYRAAEQALRSSGQEDEADDLYRQFRKRVQQRASWGQRTGMWLWGIATGYGTRPMRPIGIWSALFVGVTALLFMAHPIAVQPDPGYLASVNECGLRCAHLSVETPGTTWTGKFADAFLLTLDAGLPFFGLNATPGITTTPWRVGHWVTLAYAVLSWILLPAAAGAIASRVMRTNR